MIDREKKNYVHCTWINSRVWTAFLVIRINYIKCLIFRCLNMGGRFNGKAYPFATRRTLKQSKTTTKIAWVMAKKAIIVRFWRQRKLSNGIFTWEALPPIYYIILLVTNYERTFFLFVPYTIWWWSLLLLSCYYFICQQYNKWFKSGGQNQKHYVFHLMMMTTIYLWRVIFALLFISIGKW